MRRVMKLWGLWVGLVGLSLAGLSSAPPVAAQAGTNIEVTPESAPADAADDAADTEGEPAAAAPGVVGDAIYIPFKPAFVVNYGGAGRLKFLKAELAVRASTPAAADALRYHTPLIRNNLIMLFAAQTEADLASQEGKEALRRAALEEVRAVVATEGGLTEGVVDLYFNTLVIQN